MVSRNDGRKPGTDGPKKGNRSNDFAAVSCPYYTVAGPHFGCVATMIGNAVSDGRPLSLRAGDRLMLIAGGRLDY
jgi:hypothetical protein